MSKLIQKLSGSLGKKFKEVISPDETVYFCIQGAPGNAFIGTDRKLVAISAGSFKGTISYSYDYDNIVDIKIDPPLHGQYITLNIMAAREDKELKPKLYFETNQKKVLGKILAKISSLSNTYTYTEEMKEVSAHQTDIKLIVPMKNVLKEIFDETITSTDRYIICVSIGEHQGIVVTDQKVLIFKINETEETYETGEFLLDEIKQIDYSVGLVTGHLQIITPDVTVIEKRMREQDLININNIICFSKKNYAGLMEIVYKKLKEIVDADKEERENIFQDAARVKSSELKKRVEKKNLPGKKLKTSDEENEKIEEEKNRAKSKVKKQKPEKSSTRPAEKRQNKNNLNLEEIANKLSQDILAEIIEDEETVYTKEVVKQITEEVLLYSFPDLISSGITATITDKVMGFLDKKIPKKKVFEKDFLDESDEIPEEMDYVIDSPAINIDTDAFLSDNEEKIPEQTEPLLDAKLAEFTSLKNICGALLINSKTGNTVCSSIVDDEDYSRISNISNDFLKNLEKNKIFSNFPSQWNIEYNNGLLYLAKLTKNYFLVIAGNKDSNFGTLKVFIEKIKKELTSQLD